MLQSNMELLNRNFDVFLPMTKTIKVWKNRQKKWIEQALFPNYLFLKTCLSELYYIRQIPKTVKCLYYEGNPCILTSKEIEDIKGIINSGKEINLHTNYLKGNRIRIVRGRLLGFDGILIEQKGRSRFGVQLKGMSCAILVDIHENELEKI